MSHSSMWTIRHVPRKGFFGIAGKIDRSTWGTALAVTHLKPFDHLVGLPLLSHGDLDGFLNALLGPDLLDFGFVGLGEVPH